MTNPQRLRNVIGRLHGPSIRQTEPEHGLDRNLGGARHRRFPALHVADVRLPIVQNIRHLDLRKAQRLPGLFELCGGHGSGCPSSEIPADLVSVWHDAVEMHFSVFGYPILHTEFCGAGLGLGACHRFHRRSPVWASARFHTINMRLSHTGCKRKYAENVSRNITGAAAIGPTQQRRTE